MNESFSDIFAIAIEHHVKGEAANFLFGDEVVLDERIALRSAVNPKKQETPDTYSGEYWEYDQIHHRSNVQTHWFYLLVNGGAGINDLGNEYNIEGIGLEKAIDIAYRNLTVYLTPPSGYADARFFSIRAAMDLFGDCSFEVEQVAKAWYAVGVGEEALEVAAAFAADETEFCSETATVQFSNQSLWADSFTWDFGDGNSSEEVHPIHTYEAFGEYTVELIAHSCQEETATITKEKWVHLGENVAPCNEVVMDIIEQQILYDCQGILYDDGGAEGDYTRFKKSQITIEVADADYLTLDFSQFDASNNHELSLYDGKDDKSPQIGRYWGSRLPNDGEVIVTRGNALHLQFDPLGGENRSFSGFAMEWQCHSNTRKPLAQFTSNDTFICQGQLGFIEKSLYQATEWHWDFGDGNHSEEQNPIHVYSEKGIYDIQLIACNAFGCDTSKQVAFVQIEEDLECFEVRIPRSGKTRVAHCSGQIFDNGGELGFYSNNVSGIVVVEPPNIERIGFAIQAFNTEARDDLLLVYDGNSIDSPLLLSQSGFEFSTDTIWAESGAVTFYFRSDEAVFNPGFDIVYFSEPKAEAPQAAFSWSLADVPIFVPLSFQNQSQKANQWLWDFGDGTISKLKSPTHVYAESGVYTVTLIAKNCYTSDTLQQTVQVQSTPILQADKEQLTLTLPAGESSSQVLELSNAGTGDLYFGVENKAFERDTTVEKYYTSLAVDTYYFENLRPFSELRLELTINGDFDDDLEYMQLWVEDDYILQAGINNQSAGNGTDIEVSFFFKASSNEVIKWLEDGQLKIEVGKSSQVTLNQGGKDYYRLSVVTDHADWLQIGSKNGIIGGGTPQELLITFNAQNLWAGTYTNELHIFSNDTPNSPKIIPCTLEVIARPIAQFIPQLASICKGRVNFLDDSINEVESWVWDFGDGATSNEQSPTHEYTESGSFEVHLEVCHSGFCDETTETVTIAPIANFSFSPNDAPQQTEIRFSNQSVGFNSYEWDFGDGQTTTDRNPKHEYEVGGNYVVTLIAENCLGTDTLQKEVKVQGMPQAAISLEGVEVTLQAGQQTVENVRIQNTGLGDLSYQAVIKKEFAENTVVFEEVGATTLHVFEGVIAEDFLQLKVTLNGDFDEADERVWIRLEGEGAVHVLDNNVETGEDETHFITLAPELYRHLLADGVLEIELVNSQEVDVRADRENKHSVELIAFGVPWLETTTSNQTVSIGGERNLLLTFDARELNAGVYEIPVTITSNELPAMEYVVPTRLEVLGEAELELATTAIDFGDVRIHEASETPFQIFNSGTDTLFVSEWSIDSAVFGIGTNSLVLPPKEMYEAKIVFQPTEILDYAVSLEIQSNVGMEMLELKGKGLGAPQILVTPDSLWVVLEVGQETSRVLTTSNVGTAEMSLSGTPATFTRFDSLSTEDFAQVGDTTWHIFEGLEVTDSIRLDFVLEGDFNETWEFVEVFVNGIWQAEVGIENADSAFVVEGSLRFGWEDLVEDGLEENGLEEGRLEVMLVNSEEVNTGLTGAQNHRVRLQTFDAPWLEGALEEGVVGIGESREWEVFFDASDLPIGIYEQDIHLFLDDVERDLVVVPTTLEVVKILEAEEEMVGNNELRLYPNPAIGKVVLVSDLPKESVFQLFNLQGRELRNERLKKGSGEWILEVGDLVSGMYLYRLSLDGRMAKKGKLLLMR